jgi:hypothetical protein
MFVGESGYCSLIGGYFRNTTPLTGLISLTLSVVVGYNDSTLLPTMSFSSTNAYSDSIAPDGSFGSGVAWSGAYIIMTLEGYRFDGTFTAPASNTYDYVQWAIPSTGGHLLSAVNTYSCVNDVAVATSSSGVGLRALVAARRPLLRIGKRGLSSREERLFYSPFLALF